MEPLFENKTECSQKDYDIFLEEYKKEFTTSDYAYILFYVVFFGICVFLAFSKKEFILGFVLLTGIIIYLWYKIIRPTNMVEKTKENQKLNGNIINNYIFYKNYFKVESTEGKTQFLYFKIYRVVETKEFFYIYITRQLAYIISKNGFTKGDKREFTNFLKKKVFTKYKNRINNI